LGSALLFDALITFNYFKHSAEQVFLLDLQWKSFLQITHTLVLSLLDFLERVLAILLFVC